MASDYFARVVSGAITRVNVSAKEARKGKINFPADATDADYFALGFWPITGTKPIPDDGEIVTGPTYEVDAENSRVNRVYVTRNKTSAEIADEIIAASKPKRPDVVANAVISISSGVMSGLSAASGLAAGFQLSTGVFWVFFSEEQPDLNYTVSVTTSSGSAAVSDRGTGFIEITCRDAAGLIVPSEISVQIFRTP